MKKIAADRNYRMFKKRAQRSDEEHDNYVKVKSKLLELSQGAPGSDAAFYVFEAIRDTVLIRSHCRGEENKYKNECMDGKERGTLLALNLTEDVMTGMKRFSVWNKYREPLFRNIKARAPNANALIGWIVVNSLSIPD